jgi:hypothetical protein
MAFQEYPKAMSHPQYRPAILSQDTVDPVTRQTVKAAPGQPAKFPPVYVNNKDQEEQYASLGYLPNGVSDPEAYLSSTIGADRPDASHGPVEFPKFLYARDDDGGDMHVHAETGETVRVKSLMIKDQAQQDKLVGAWYATPGDAANASDEADEAEEAGSEAEEGTQEAAETAPQRNKRR